MSVRLWRVSLLARASNGAELVNVIHVKDDAPTSGDLFAAAGMADEIATWLATTWKGTHIPGTRCETITVREVVKEWLGETPSGAVHTVDAPGTLGVTRDGKLDYSLCIRGAVHTDVPKRYARGGIFFGPSLHSGDLDGTGHWLTSSAYYTACNAFKGALLAGHDHAPLNVAHMSYIVYSITRHKLDAATYYFDAKDILLKTRIARLNSRNTVP